MISNPSFVDCFFFFLIVAVIISRHTAKPQADGDAIQSLGANPVRSIGLAWLSSIMLVSTLRGCLRAQSMQVVTPGRASSRSEEMGLLHRPQSFRGGFFSSLMTTTSDDSTRQS
jgi:hypothetical protein